MSNPITITFNQPVGSVTVTAYDPTFDGDSIAAFTADGTVIGTAEFPGNHHPGMLTTQTRTLTGSISSVVLTPAPLDYVAYSMTVGVSLPTLNVACTPAEPLRGTEVHCVASMSDSSLYVLSRLRSSTSGGTTVVDQTIIPSAPRALYDWNGLAATETHVEVFGSRDGVIVSAATTFGISQRTTFQDAIQPEMPPQLQGNGLPTMGTVYPGLHSTPNGWEIEMGGLGRTWHLFPDYDLRIIPSGPNTNLVFAENFRWEDSKPLRENSPIPSGTYLSVALFPGDPFYGLQDGRNGNCSASQVNILRDEMYQHELIHYGSAIQIRKQLKLHQFYESKLALSGNGAISHAIEVAFFLPTRQYNLGVKASDAGIDADSTTIARTSLTCQMRFP